jgi:hypothetical protein
MSSLSIALVGLLGVTQSTAEPIAQVSDPKPAIQLAADEQLSFGLPQLSDPAKVILADVVIEENEVDDDDDDDDRGRDRDRDRDRDGDRVRGETDVEHHVETQEPENWAGTIAVSALAGGLVGALVGTSIYLLDRPDSPAINISYWTAGGVLLGVGVGVIQVAVQEKRVEEAVSQRVLDDSEPPRAFGLTVAF